MSKFEPSICYKLNITLASPLSVGSGENMYTDHDIIVDRRGLPMIPATAIAGVLGAWLGDSKEQLLGRIRQKRIIDGKEHILDKLESKVRVYDAVCTESKSNSLISTRDNVKLKNKTAVDGAKFDTQIVNAGTKFCAYIELLDIKYINELEEFFCAVNSGYVRLGAKTTRGYGRVELNVFKYELNDVDTWLKFKMFDDSSWLSAEELVLNSEGSSMLHLCVGLKCRGGISIREYSTDINMPDYITVGMKLNEQAVIPGTSWAGAIKSRFKEIIGNAETENLFGYVDEKTKCSKKSRIIFSESIIEKGIPKEITRNSIDRFSGGTKAGALYTEKTSFYGTTVLDIFIDKKVSGKQLSALAVCLADLHNGFLAVGGLTAIGRGLFEITNINNNPVLSDCIISETVNVDGFVKEVLKNVEN